MSIGNDPQINQILDEIAHWHSEYEHAADPDDFGHPGDHEAAQLSSKVGELLAALGRPVKLG
ncbi:MAG: hypothetical protein PHQ28_00075 [Mycobacterium sp.]|nr:hypothetical protein [Mycobacterium sp.]